MPRAPRRMPQGYAYHVLNRAAGQRAIFADPLDAARFVTVLAQAVERTPEAGLLAWCLMPNHWHLVFHPSSDDVLQPMLHWLTLTHTQRHRAVYRTAGEGHLYQGRYRSFPIATDEHLLVVLRYVERNPVRAGLVRGAAEWRWSSATPTVRDAEPPRPGLSPWPIERPHEWLAFVDQPLTPAEEADQRQKLRRATRRGSPLGDSEWALATAARLGLAATLRPPGRPPRA
jgi:putative transposase